MTAGCLRPPARNWDTEVQKASVEPGSGGVLRAQTAQFRGGRREHAGRSVVRSQGEARRRTNRFSGLLISHPRCCTASLHSLCAKFAYFDDILYCPPFLEMSNTPSKAKFSVQFKGSKSPYLAVSLDSVDFARLSAYLLVSLSRESMT